MATTRINQEHIKLAQTLPKRLLNFFRKYPPPILTAQNWTPPSTPQLTPEYTPPAATAASSTAHSTATPTTDAIVASATESAATAEPVDLGPAADQHPTTYYNPFMPRKNFKTGKWYGPVYGLRKQADIVKLAQAHGVVNLLPYTIKLPEVRLRRRLEGGLRVKGTGVGEKVKGKTWERTLKGRLEERRKAMLDMPRLVQEWKQKGHGRGWKKWPK